MVMLEPPLPFGNAAARWYYAALKSLSARGHTVVALASISDERQRQAAQELFPAPRYDLRLFAEVRHKSWRKKWVSIASPYSYVLSAEMRACFAAELENKPDIVHLEHQWCAYLPHIPVDRTLLNIHYLQSIDLNGVPAATTKDRLLALAVRRSEPTLVRKFRFVRTLTPELAAAVRQIAPRAQVQAVPLAMDLSLYPYAADSQRPTQPTVCLIGSMNWYPTFSAALRLLRHIWPLIKQAVPDAQLQIVGWNARARLASYIGEDLAASVHLHENVPDARPYFYAASVLVYAPAQGSGMKVKVLEAMAYGVPVVTTTDGAEGLPVTNGVEALLAHSDADLAAHCIALLRDGAAQNRQRAAARQMLDQTCDPERVVDQIETIYRTMIERLPR